MNPQTKGLRKPTHKTIAYMHRMISAGKWKVNQRIPTQATISGALNVSQNTVRKAIAILEHEKVLENNGSLGYTVIPQSLVALYKANKQMFYLQMAKRHVAFIDFVNSGGKILGSHAIKAGEEGRVWVMSLVSGDVTSTTIEEIEGIVDRPIKAKTLLKYKGHEFTKMKRLYAKQQLLLPACETILRNRKELGL